MNPVMNPTFEDTIPAFDNEPVQTVEAVIVEADGFAPSHSTAVAVPLNVRLLSKKSTPMDRGELATLPTFEGSGRHKPIPHIRLIESIQQVLAERDITIRDEEFSVNRDGNAMFGVMRLAGRELSLNSDFSSALGLRTANDKSMSLQLAVGANVLVCDNMAFHADMIALKKKHTTGLDLIADLREAVTRFIEKFGKLAVQFDDLKNRSINDNQAKAMIYDVFAADVVAPRYFPLVNQAYFQPTGAEFEAKYSHTMWALHNAFTWALKQAPMTVRQRATLELAQTFQLT